MVGVMQQDVIASDFSKQLVGTIAVVVDEPWVWLWIPCWEFQLIVVEFKQSKIVVQPERLGEFEQFAFADF
ncbi:hypothetical protein SAMN06264855_101404 [Halorubrum vacuolatum]|uniref:Uncharacterized protein n=1 Tax=Halorubrum vacuolatum TaxID=63740 RepID=A0A238UUU0_HALVU|nr:hypothetical protein SAMN06264855_101404 [Halorubrum vacuolatum]